jgi:predicted PurR-regulated permease PerM
VAEAVSLTVQLQFIVAACNAVLTLPVLWLIGVPHVPMLMLLIFVSGLIPVVGNLISGAVLSVVAYQTRGFVGVGLFIGLTFVLHKVESYFLNPRLAARHVPLPGFVLILSLIAWEHLLGFVGLFVSFPFLYVTGKLITEFQSEGAPPQTVEAASG